MTIGFEYDPEELVSFQGRDISLRDAVHRYLELKEHPDPFVDVAALRDPGKEPQIPTQNSGPPAANPPPLPEEEIRPDDLIKQNNDAMAPDPANRTEK